MSKLKVAIIFGGKSGEHEVSIASATSVYKALDPARYEATLIGIDKSGRWLMPDQSKVLSHAANPRLLKLNQETETVSLVPFESDRQLVSIASSASAGSSATKALENRDRFDVVLPILHGTYGEDGTIQGLLELANLPYIGSGVVGSSVGMDKDVSRRLMVAAGIPCVPTKVVRKKEFETSPDQVISEAIKTLGLPFFVKPANMGSSVGVAKVKTEADAKSKIRNAFLYDTKILIEKGIDARELECSVLGNDDPKASIVGEIVPRHEFYSYEAKYIDENGADLKIPAEGLSQEQIARIQKLSIDAFLALECKGLARVDFFLDRKTGEMYLNEINTIPGFTKISMYPKLWEATGLAYPKLLDRLIELALERHREKNSLKTSYEPEET